MKKREDRIKFTRQNPNPSVLIVGGGINGIGVFRDLALQGVDVLMVDQGDYCSGTSAASSHMAHGGIRYLENGEFRLVREAVQERNRLIEHAPHLVKPLPTTIPIFRRFSGLINAPLKFLGIMDRPAERGAIVIKLGMTLYDSYTRSQGTVPRHIFLNRPRSLARFPALNPQILYTGTYYDGAILSPERLAVELVLDGVEANEKAIPLNYVRASGIRDNQIVLVDEVDGEELAVHPRVVVNAGGPWIDLINATFGRETKYVGGTKGSHLVLDNPELRRAIGENEFFFENKDGRMVLVFPLGDRVLIGTSDIRTDSPDEAVVTDEEVAYFFDMVARVFPGIKVDRSQIVFTYSGVRPLRRSDSARPGQISRDHTIEEFELEGEPGLKVYSLVGGKWTSFRAFSEQVCERILAYFGETRAVSTRDLGMGGGRGYPQTDEGRADWIDRLATQSGQPRDRVETLLDRYGTRAELFASFVSAGQDRWLSNLPTYSSREISYIAECEDVVHLDDFVLRRSMIGMLGELTQDGLQELGHVVEQTLRWNAEQTRIEIKRMAEILKSKHRMSFEGFESGDHEK